MRVDIDWLFLPDEAHLVPDDLSTRAPAVEDLTLIPQQGDVVVMAPRSAWLVVNRHFQWVDHDSFRILIHVAHAPDQLALHPPALKPTLVEPQATRPE